jgi:hypothetical protein
LRICVLDGICPDCCVDVDPETATLAAAMMDCQTVACMENPVCDAFSEFVCSTAGG